MAAGSAPSEPQAGEDPAQVPAPHLQLQGMPCLSTKSPSCPWRPQGGRMKSGGSEAFFKLTLRRCLSRKTKIKSFGRKVEKYTQKHEVLLPQPGHKSPAHSFPSP